MQVLLLVAILVAALAVVFAVQNTDPVTVDFLFWSFEGSKALILLVALAAGAIASSLASIPSMFRASRQAASLRRRVEELETEVRTLRQVSPPSPPAAEKSAGEQNP